jgi:hypothetical protein
MRSPDEIVAAAERFATPLSDDDTDESIDAEWADLRGAIHDLFRLGPDAAIETLTRLDEHALLAVTMGLLR